MTPHPLHVVGAAVLRDGRCLATQRSATMAAPLEWEFPGGKVEPNEDPRIALRREEVKPTPTSLALSFFLPPGFSA